MKTLKFEIRPFSDNHAEAILAIYEQSFPPEERRPYADANAFESFVSSNSKIFSILVITPTDGGEPLGFVTVWEFPEFLYIEHLAVSPEARGAGLGAKLVTEVADRAEALGKGVLLEVEIPEPSASSDSSEPSYSSDSSDSSDLAARRIRFYERLGFRQWPDFEYIQPPYSPALPPVALMLMTRGMQSLPAPSSISDFQSVVYRNPFI